jgi:hypothetical protein
MQNERARIEVEEEEAKLVQLKQQTKKMKELQAQEEMDAENLRLA